ncbi:AfsR/SARP family transcriptional regulator [Virgisporangium aurantiacum]|uniref:DNA-binding transcriptional activator of the SARP family n=1 Tax=Virgisporangium aurantiacum TaxID=175570 RepID=A0A8J3Z3T7_9ACTN|nr:BTAD domain-containing putative transcriptional regulator [Virgisporangium aurantiacum]GIJ56804.1 hypothetical protein Vau01_043200 [Virgisporangium aurantiacum]
MLTVGVLGPLEVSVCGQPVCIRASKLRTLVMVLAMTAGAPVSVDRLADAVWDEKLPVHLRRALQTLLTRLRGVLGRDAIVTDAAGYRLRVDPDHVDALRFGRLLGRAARASDPVSERGHLEAALALWRGDPFDGSRLDWSRGQRVRLVEGYLAALERRVDLDLAEGRAGEAVVLLREVAAAHPLREPLLARFLMALTAAGRRAEALAEYESIRRRLAEELGTDPGPELRRIHAGLLVPARELRPALWRTASRPGPVIAAVPAVPAVPVSR